MVAEGAAWLLSPPAVAPPQVLLPYKPSFHKDASMSRQASLAILLLFVPDSGSSFPHVPRFQAQACETHTLLLIATPFLTTI